MMMMFTLQLSVALLCLVCFTTAALDLQKAVKINGEMKALQKEKQDIAKQYVSTSDFSSNVLDKAVALVEQMEEMVEEFGIKEELPSVAVFVENLKVFLEETKSLTSENMQTLLEEYRDKDTQITSLLLKLLEV